MSNPKVNTFSLSDADKLSWEFEKIHLLRRDISSFLVNFENLNSLSVLQLEFLSGLLKSLIYVTNTSLDFPYRIDDLNSNLNMCMAIEEFTANIDDTYLKLSLNQATLIEVGELIILMSDCYKMISIKERNKQSQNITKEI